mmetsp:Transcript_91661/g.268272  ORF Transcript_91661/g.268272 Transcript_91661/m.268272 type:complete len:217 (-) Transcript_91661:12-662(-)
MLLQDPTVKGRAPLHLRLLLLLQRHRPLIWQEVAHGEVQIQGALRTAAGGGRGRAGGGLAGAAVSGHLLRRARGDDGLRQLGVAGHGVCRAAYELVHVQVEVGVRVGLPHDLAGLRRRHVRHPLALQEGEELLHGHAAARVRVELPEHRLGVLGRLAPTHGQLRRLNEGHGIILRRPLSPRLQGCSKDRREQPQHPRGSLRASQMEGGKVARTNKV